MTLLKTIDLCKAFGGLMAVYNLNLEVGEGEIVGLIGPNGAGKSTTFNLIAGLLEATHGKVLFRDEDIIGLKPYEIAGKGIARTFQQTSLFHTMTVEENLRTALHLHRRVSGLGAIFNTAAYRQAEREEDLRINEFLEFVGLEGNIRHELIGFLPYGHQRLLGVAMALAADPILLMLDEPMAGMNQQECVRLVKVIRKIRDDRKCTILLVEHNVQAVMEVCEKVTVLDYGKEIARGVPAEIVKNPVVIEAYLGAAEGELDSKD